jgi:plasmid stabilization system protein ParE
MRVRWSKRALGQVVNAGVYVVRDREHGVLRWAEDLVSAMWTAGEFPESGRVVPEIGNPRIREIIHRDVRVIYRIDPAELVVMMVWPARRDARKLVRQLERYRGYSRDAGAAADEA